ncbi:MAG: nucleoside triphosphate pyrophosphatase [Patescibacteria group bacterium]
MKIILGSSSKFRQKVMQDLGYDFEVISPNIDEKNIRDNDLKKLVLKIAYAKANAIIEKIKEPALIITADQVISFNGTIREKPVSKEEAYQFLSSYKEKPLEAINGIVVTNTKRKIQKSGIDIVKVYLRPIPKNIINKLIDEGLIFHCAGALRFEDPLMKPFIQKIEGSEGSLMGLPKILTIKLITNVIS